MACKSLFMSTTKWTHSQPANLSLIFLLHLLSGNTQLYTTSNSILFVGATGTSGPFFFKTAFVPILSGHISMAYVDRADTLFLFA